MAEKRYYSLLLSSLFQGQEYAGKICQKDTTILKSCNIRPELNWLGNPKLSEYSFVISLDDYHRPAYKLIKLYIDGENSDYIYHDSDWKVIIPRCFISNCDNMLVIPIKVIRKSGIINYYRYHIESKNHGYHGSINNADLYTAQVLSIMISTILYQFSDSYPWNDRFKLKALLETYTVFRYSKTES